MANTDKANRKVNRILKSYASIRNFKVLHNVTFEYKGKRAVIDHLMVGFFGMLFVSSYDFKGQIYGDAREDSWLFVTQTKSGEKKERSQSPVARNLENNGIVRNILAAENIYRTPIDNAIVVHGPAKKLDIFAPVETLNIFSLKQLKKYIRKAKFDKDCDIDVEQIITALKKYEVTE